MSDEEGTRRVYRQEVEKLPRARCADCGVDTVLQLMKRTGMMDRGREQFRCRNEIACRRRQRRAARAKALSQQQDQRDADARKARARST